MSAGRQPRVAWQRRRGLLPPVIEKHRRNVTWIHWLAGFPSIAAGGQKTIRVRAGTYREAVDLTGWDGTAGSPNVWESTLDASVTDGSVWLVVDGNGNRNQPFNLTITPVADPP